jgi:hypothetical protein
MGTRSLIEPIIQRSGSQREIGRQSGKENVAPELARKRSGRERRRQSRDSKKLQRNPERRTYSFSPGRDTIRVPRDSYQQHPVPPLPDNVGNMAGPSTAMTNGEKSDHDVPMPDVRDDIGRVPTLHKRSGHELLRRKSSKRRKEDHDREAEIKAMSSFMPTPIRASTTPDTMGRPMKRDTIKMRGFNRMFTNPASDVSLPLQESIHSSLSSNSERHISYELKGMFSPHPTIRYSGSPRYAPPPALPGLERSDSKRKRTLDAPIPKETLKAAKRIDELADDLDASDLRELMERADRRRDKKKADDREKMARKLAKRAAKQKQDEREAIEHGLPPPKNLDRGVMGRELQGLGIVEGEPSGLSRKASNASSRRRGKRPEPFTPEELRAPVPEFSRTGSLPPTEPGSPTSEREIAIIEIAQVARLSRANMSPPSSPKDHKRSESSISQLIDLQKPTIPRISAERPSGETQKLDQARRGSSEASTKQHSSWTSFFKRRSKDKRELAQSSFSNTTRESLITPQPPSVTYAVSSNSSSAAPKRTMSRFREDLPELPISPPDSRVQSPEAENTPPIYIQNRHIDTAVRATVSARDPFLDGPSRRYDTPTSGFHSVDPPSRLRNGTPASGRRSADVPSPELTNAMSQSLASIDSEGSWLSGRPRAGSKRSSAQQPVPLRESSSSLEKRYKEFSDSAEELGIAEDEYFSRMTPGPEEMYNKSSTRPISGNPMPSSDDEDGDSVADPRGQKTKWGAVARTPTVIRATTARSDSRQGQMGETDDSEAEDSVESPRSDKRDEEVETPETPEGHGLQRATSVDYKAAHMRHISAGSARLLDLKPRASGESKRASVGN